TAPSTGAGETAGVSAPTIDPSRIVIGPGGLPAPPNVPAPPVPIPVPPNLPSFPLPAPSK
ncbi:MAG: hypothetical protein ACRD12_10955, partial [Acidimicrobiales bacterium]